jgi:hypothetical protein
MGQVGADVWALEEVCDEDRLQTVLNTLAAQGQPFEPVYPDQDLTSHGVSNPYGNYAGPWGQKTTFLFRTDRVRKLGAELVYNPSDQVNGGSIDSSWGSTFASRDPLQVHLELSTSSGPWDLWFLVVHLKAESGQSTSYPQRAQESADLKTYLDQYHPADRVMVVGDFNDDLDQSINGVDPSPFQNFLDDSANWSFPSMAFTQAGLGTTTRYPNAIDHHLISDEVFGALVKDSPEVVHPSISSYSGTTSDHLPTVVRYQLP